MNNSILRWFNSFRYTTNDVRKLWIKHFLKSWIQKTNSSELEAWKIWSRKPISSYPYTWEKEYTNQHINVYQDDNTNLHYIIHNDKKLFFPKKVKHPNITYRNLLIEQDPRSAHRYLAHIEDISNKILIDGGSAEGLFSLDVINKVKHIYLIECDSDWIQPLKNTFAPFSHKVTIINKFLSSKDDDNNISLNKLLHELSNEDIFIKMDIEGFERVVLENASESLLSHPSISGSICIYHNQEDESTINSILNQLNFKTTINQEYLFFGGNMRHAIIQFNR